MAINRLCSCNPKPLGEGMKYHYSVLYNYYEGPSSGRRGDQLLAWNFLKDLKRRLSEKGYDKVMYHDIARPGSNIFSNLFSMITESEKIVVLLTPEFIQNGWHKYSGQAALKNLLDKHKTHSRILPIAINITKENIPDNLGLSISSFIFTGYDDNEADEGVWDSVLREFGYTEPHYEKTGYNESYLTSMGHASEQSAPVEPGDVDHTPMSIDISSIPLRYTDTGPTPPIAIKSDLDTDGAGEETKKERYNATTTSETNNYEGKPRGKIPRWHEEILRKNRLTIMENIRVKDIIDHLYSENIIDSDEMDEIQTRLTSKGNREALSKLMRILYNSCHRALPKFIQCLRQSGYFDLAKCLQGDMDNVKALAQRPKTTNSIEFI